MDYKPYQSEVVWSDDEGGRRPATRAAVEHAIEQAVDVMADPNLMATLPGPFLFWFLEHGLPVMAAQAGKYARVRVEQSYSKQKADRPEDAPDADTVGMGF